MRHSVDDEAEDLVPLGDVLDAVDDGKRAAARNAASSLLSTMRTPPHAMDAERCVIGAILLNPACLLDVQVAGLRPADMYHKAHATMFEAIEACADAGEPIDALCVVEKLRKSNKLDAVGGAAAVASLAALMPTSAHATAYAQLVREKAQLRALIDVSTKIVEAAYAQTKSPSDIIEAAERAVLAVSSSTATVEHVDRKSIVEEILRDIDRPEVGKVPLGLPSLDKRLGGGIGAGELVVVAARPSMGKSGLAMQAMGHIADQGLACAFYSLEMKGKPLLRREIANKAQLAAKKWRSGTNEQRGALARAAGDVSERPLHIIDRSGMSFHEIASSIRRYVSREGVGAVAIDYLQLLSGSDVHRRNGDKNNEVAEMSKGLKGLAGELSIPIIVLSQLNRGVESRTDKRPMMSDLRDSGAIEQDADVILFLYRPEYYLRESCPRDLQGVAEVIIAKQREGDTGTVQLGFKRDEVRFYEGVAP